MLEDANTPALIGHNGGPPLEDYYEKYCPPQFPKARTRRAMQTLECHGATEDEIDFLIVNPFLGGFYGKRVELNALASDELIAFIEDKFEAHGVCKVIPDDDILEQHARRMLERRIVVRELDKLLPDIRKRVGAADLPDDLHGLVEALLEEQPALPWDSAIADIIEEVTEGPDDLDEGHES
ncbi:MAG: hypothetical protein WA459_25180 [Stellaceae bacterium]